MRVRLAGAGLGRLYLARYPFLRAASSLVAELGLDLSELSSPTLAPVLKRALGRVVEGVRRGKVSPGLEDEYVELLSFPVAIALVASTRNEFLRRRYALAEAKRAEELLALEPLEKLLAIARDFGWWARPVGFLENGIFYEFSLALRDYLRNAAGLKDKKWRLVNRLVRSGRVLATRAEVARLLAEEVRRRVEELVLKAMRELREVPGPLKPYVEKVLALLSELKLGEGPSLEAAGEVEFEAFPPCMKAIYAALSERRHVPHAGRFAFTAFLLNIGMSVDEIVELFRRVADFSEKITRYQVEHIAGERGGRTRYTPPSCKTMRSYGLCVGADELCQRVGHPLTYYRRRLWRLRKARRAGQAEREEREAGEASEGGEVPGEPQGGRAGGGEDS